MSQGNRDAKPRAWTTTAILSLVEPLIRRLIRRSLSGSGIGNDVIDHGMGIEGLSDDDHPQYLLDDVGTGGEAIDVTNRIIRVDVDELPEIISSDSEGFNDPTAEATRAGTGVVTPTKAFASDDTYAVFSDTSEHDYQAFNFSVPVGCFIVGVTVRVEWHTSQPTDMGFLTVQLLDDLGNQIGAPKITPIISGSTDIIQILGGPFDTWSVTLTDAIVNDADFGVSILYTRTSGGPSNKASLDNVDITINHAPTGVPIIDPDADFLLVLDTSLGVLNKVKPSNLGI